MTSTTGVIITSTALRRLALLGATFSATAPTAVTSLADPTTSKPPPSKKVRYNHIKSTDSSSSPTLVSVQSQPRLASVRLKERSSTEPTRSTRQARLAHNRRHHGYLIRSSVPTSSAVRLNVLDQSIPNDVGLSRRSISFMSLFRPTSAVHVSDRVIQQDASTTPPATSLQSAVTSTTRGLSTAEPSLHTNDTNVREHSRSDQGQQSWQPSISRSEAELDQINTLLRHPALFTEVFKPRLPIVLCHGLYGFDVRGPTFFRLHYWGDLLKILRGTIGAEVYVTAVPGTGSIKQRAHTLHHALEENVALKDQDLNFLAHSMGGLDARYLFSAIRPETYRPQSLTTLSTPHRGSEFMAWCRANIGIGTDFDATSEAAARAAHEDSAIPLPYSLKTPILSRAQVAEAKKTADATRKAEAAAEKVKAAINIPGVPIPFSATVATYVLDLLDSPAYANLTPSFLREVFNPMTPDRPDIKYFSVASRTDKIPIWHPLWLPKQVLDGAETARAAKGLSGPSQWRGNDGLVTIESAKWGEFLGVVENCDHWEMRGSSGLVSAQQTAAKAIDDATGKKEGSGGWQWQDLYALIGKGVLKTAPSGKTKVKEGEQAEKVAQFDNGQTEEQRDHAKGLAAVASWVGKLIPGAGLASAAAPVSAAINSIASTVTPNSASSSGRDQNQSALGPGGLPKSARLLYGAPMSSSAASSSKSSGDGSTSSSAAASTKVKPEKFSLERMAMAVCRKLHYEGL